MHYRIDICYSEDFMSKLFQDNEGTSVSSLFIVSVKVKLVKILIPKAVSARELLYLARDVCVVRKTFSF